MSVPRRLLCIGPDHPRDTPCRALDRSLPRGRETKDGCLCQGESFTRYFGASRVFITWTADAVN